MTSTTEMSSSETTFLSPPHTERTVLNSSSETDEIPTVTRPACALCGSGGRPLHSNLQDRLFGVSGRWDLTECTEKDCGLVWLNPAPAPEHLGKAYTSYYTHAPTPPKATSSIKNAYQYAIRRWQDQHMGYPKAECEPPHLLLQALCHLIPGVARRAASEVAYLPFVPGGKLLDVGCGAGEWLTQMQNLGWNVEGVDFDPNAVAVARARNLKVHTGALESLHFPAESFDAIHLCHVIEHVPDPRGAIEECARLLRPGGRLVLFTPNTSSLSHRLFKQDWRGLEPPRHLHLFSFTSMSKLFAGASFGSPSILAHVGTSVTAESYKLKRQRRPLKILDRILCHPLFWRVFSEIQECILPIFPSVGETLAVVAIKQ